MLRKCEGGNVQATYVVTILCVALAGASGWSAFGGSLRSAIAGNGALADNAATTSHGTSGDSAVSAQAGLLSRFVEGARALPGQLIDKTFASLARRAKGRVLHDTGVLYRAKLELSTAVNGVTFGHESGDSIDAFVRVSRALKTAQPKPTPLGFALRLETASGGFDDLLSVSVGKSRRIIHNAPGFFEADNRFSSLLPFSLKGEGDRKYLILVEPKGSHGPRAAGMTDLQEVEALARRGEAQFDLVLAPLHGKGSRIRLGEISLEAPLSDAESKAFAFHPWENATIEPTGFINGLRKPVYEGSQGGRGAALASDVEAPLAQLD